MDPICRLGLRCLKKDEPLEACHSAGCPNAIHPSCFKKVMLAVAEGEWEGLLFCGKRCFNSNKKMQEAAMNKNKGRVLHSSTISSIRPLEIVDCEVSDSGVDNKPVAVDTINIKQTTGYAPTLKKKPRASPTSFSSKIDRAVRAVKRDADEWHKIQGQADAV